jgi:hypothetical protein
MSMTIDFGRILAEAFDKGVLVEPLEVRYHPVHPMAQNRRALIYAEKAEALFQSNSDRKAAMLLMCVSHAIATSLDIFWMKPAQFSPVKGSQPLPLVINLSDTERAIYLGDRMKTIFLLAVCYGEMNNVAEKNRLLDIVERDARLQQNYVVLSMIETARKAK